MKVASKLAFILSPSMPGKLKTGIILALIILVVTCFVGYYSFQKTIDNVQLVKHTHQVKLKVEELSSAMKDVNRSLSGILLRRDLAKTMILLFTQCTGNQKKCACQIQRC